jgi:hypothetical protein
MSWRQAMFGVSRRSSTIPLVSLTTFDPFWSPAVRSQAPPIDSGASYDSWILRTLVGQASVLVMLGNAPVEESENIHHCDLVIVEGARKYRRAYDNVAKAFRLVQPGGLVVWPDYAKSPETRAQDRALRMLALDLPLAQIAGTMLVTYRPPGLLNISRRTCSANPPIECALALKMKDVVVAAAMTE